MRLQSAVIAALVLAALATPGSAFAHHCFEAEFDAAAPVILKGAISDVLWVNPHTKFHVLTFEPGKPPQAWAFWGATPNALLRSGITKAMLAKGVEMTISGYQAKDKECPVDPRTLASTCVADGRSLMLASDGKRMFIGASGIGAPPDPFDTGGAPQPNEKRECQWKRAN